MPERYSLSAYTSTKRFLNWRCSMIFTVQCSCLLPFLVLSSTSLSQEPQIPIESDRAAVEEMLIEGLSLRRNGPSCMGFVSQPAPSEIPGTGPIHAAAYTAFGSNELESVLSFRLNFVTNNPRGHGWIGDSNISRGVIFGGCKV